MKKKTRQRMTSVDRTRQPRLALARDTVRTLGYDELVNAVGGEASCDSTTTPTQTTKVTNRH
jgi:hypothetical protein